MLWSDTYAEMANKMRWAIITSLGTVEINLPFSSAQRIGAMYAAEVVEGLKELSIKPNLDLAAFLRSRVGAE